MPRNSITRQRKLSVDAKGWAGCAGNFSKFIFTLFCYSLDLRHGAPVQIFIWFFRGKKLKNIAGPVNKAFFNTYYFWPKMGEKFKRTCDSWAKSR